MPRGWIAGSRPDYTARWATCRVTASKRSRPGELVPGTLRVLSARMNYWPPARADGARDAHAALADDHAGYVSRYALGRDYHKLMRNSLQELADDIVAQRRAPSATASSSIRRRCWRRALARNAGLGWIGKHTSLIDTRWRFVFLPRRDLTSTCRCPSISPASAHCGTCSRCIDICPTGAIVAPYRLDARRCISYLTIEHEGAIPDELRRMIGQPHLRLRRLPAGLPVEQVRAHAPTIRISGPASTWITAALAELFAWSEDGIPGAHRRLRRSAASATSAGCAISPWRWATHPPRRRCSRRWQSRRGRRLRAGARARRLGARGTRAPHESASVLTAQVIASAWLAPVQTLNCTLSMSRALPSRDAANTTNCRVSGLADASERASRTLK